MSQIEGCRLHFAKGTEAQPCIMHFPLWKLVRTIYCKYNMMCRLCVCMLARHGESYPIDESAFPDFP